MIFPFLALRSYPLLHLADEVVRRGGGGEGPPRLNGSSRLRSLDSAGACVERKTLLHKPFDLAGLASLGLPEPQEAP